MAKVNYAAEEDSGSLGARAAGGRILVVEDDPSIRALLLGLLGVEFEVEVTRNGDEGQACWNASRQEGRHYDALLTDMEMPGVNGVDLLRSVKAEGFKGCMMLMSGNVEGGHQAMEENPWISAFVAKPFSGRELRQSLHQCIHESRKGMREQSPLGKVAQERPDPVTISKAIEQKPTELPIHRHIF